MAKKPDKTQEELDITKEIIGLMEKVAVESRPKIIATVNTWLKIENYEPE